jgi:hypothetical protein
MALGCQADPRPRLRHRQKSVVGTRSISNGELIQSGGFRIARLDTG